MKNILFCLLLISPIALQAQNKNDVKTDLNSNNGVGKNEVLKQIDKVKNVVDKVKNFGKQTVEELKAKPAKEELDVEALNQDLESFFTAFIYDPENRRDPFVPPAQQKKQNVDVGKGRKIVSTIDSLKSFESSDYRVIGIMWNVNKPKAMLIDPNDRIHTVYKDDRLGKRDGYISGIKENGVVVIEPIIDTRKNAKKKFRTITLEVED